MTAAPIVWSIAGTDSGGGAGIAADQRAADACGVHLCTVVAAVTAQNSVGVRHVAPMPVALLDAQMTALEHDLRPAAVKTGLLGGAGQIACVARWIDRLRERGPVALVVDPVLGSTTGAAFADADTLRAYRDVLLPRATLVTPNRQEAARLAGLPAETGAPELAAALRHGGAGSVCITGGDDASPDGLALDWLDTPPDGWPCPGCPRRTTTAPAAPSRPPPRLRWRGASSPPMRRWSPRWRPPRPCGMQRPRAVAPGRCGRWRVSWRMRA
jgi:hydroxymethylpyrimidine kinase/phosphomethylpyrimidine kinase/thiamine-phosphate diphosphorylase